MIEGYDKRMISAALTFLSYGSCEHPILGRHPSLAFILRRCLGKARWFGSSVNVPARTGIECGPTRPSVLGMRQWATKPYLVGYDVLQGYHLRGSWRLGD